MQNDTLPAISKHLVILETDEINTLGVALIELIAQRPEHQASAADLLDRLMAVEEREYVAAGAAGGVR